MKNWRQVDQLDDVEHEESLEYIRAKFGAYKMSIKGAQNFVYFKCTKNTCNFQLRWERRNGELQALREHNHAVELGSLAVERMGRRGRPKSLDMSKNEQSIETNTEELSNNSTKEEISSSDQSFQIEMKEWRQVDQLDDVEKEESLEYIRAKFGAYKMSIKGAQNFVYFKCTKNTCNFQIRWEKRNGELQALREHNHPFEFGSTRKYRIKLRPNLGIENKNAGAMVSPKKLPNNATKDANLPTVQTQKVEGKFNQSAVPDGRKMRLNLVSKKKNIFNKSMESSNSTAENSITVTDDPLEQFCQIDLNKKKWWNDLDKMVFMSDEQLEEYVAKQKAQREQRQFNAFKESVKQILLATTKANKDKRGAYWDNEEG